MIKQRKWYESRKMFLRRVCREVDRMNDKVFPEGVKIFEVDRWGDYRCRTLHIENKRDSYMLMPRYSDF